jgi:deoxyribodipyrimidine photo-lyase
MSKIGIFIFRKDLRIYDNLALYDLYNSVDKIILIFILDDTQIIETTKNKNYRSNSAVQFICESLIDLNKQCNNKLHLLFGDPELIIQYVIKEIKPDYIAFNSDFTQYAIKRDTKIIKICKSNNIEVITNDYDQILVPFEKIIKPDKTPYMIFGAFYKNAIKHKVNHTINIKSNKFIESNKFIKYKFTFNKLSSLYDYNKDLLQNGGRSIALKRLNVYDKKNFKNRDFLTTETFHISAHMNFGCISIREFYEKYKNDKAIISQIYWRDFYQCILKYHPNGNDYNFLDDRFKKIKWKSNDKEWKLMIESKTGFHLIDAGMKELITTGFIHNRMRLLLAQFWIKYLMINCFDSKYGSHVGFSKYLVDATCSQNKLNHSFVISELDLPGRRFIKPKSNPLTGRQMSIDNKMIKKYDPTCEYIKKWLPHLKDKTPRELINDKDYIFDPIKRYEDYCKMLKNA